MPEQKIERSTLYLIPTPLSPYSPAAWEPERLLRTIPAFTLDILQGITHFIVESEKSAGRLLSRLLSREQYSRIVFFQLNEHSSEHDLDAPLAMLAQGTSCGLLSEAGMPCVADPGAALVAAAHRAGIRIVPLGSDSSIILGLASSGLNGQSFNFLGYLPIDVLELRKKLSAEGISALKDNATRIFIETPYRNVRTMKESIAVLPEELHLCWAGNLGTDEPLIISKSVSMWKKTGFDVPEIPAVFCFGKPALLPPADDGRRSSRFNRRAGRDAP